MAGLPTVLIAAHPVKNAGEDNLIPLGAGAILNEVDGNLTLWGTARPSPETQGGCKLFWLGKIRGTFMEPLHFPLKLVSAPRVLDIHGKEVPAPVLLPKGKEPSEDSRAAADVQNRHILAVFKKEPTISQRELAAEVRIKEGSISRRIKLLESKRLIRRELGKVIVTPLGLKIAEFPGQNEPKFAPGDILDLLDDSPKPEHKMAN
jgi:hypothetical protein